MTELESPEAPIDFEPEMYSPAAREALDKIVEILTASEQQHLEKSKANPGLSVFRSPSSPEIAIGGNVALHESRGASEIQRAIDIINGDNPALAIRTALKVVRMITTPEGAQFAQILSDEQNKLGGSRAA